MRKLREKLLLRCTVGLCLCLFALSIKGQDTTVQRSPARDNDVITTQVAEVVFSAGREAASLKTPWERVEWQLEAARLLVDINRDASLRLANDAWDSLNSWAEERRKSAKEPSPRFGQLRSRLLDLFLKIDPAKASRLAASLSESDRDDNKDRNEAEKLSGRQKADELVRLALKAVDSSPDKALEGALASVALTGKISDNLRLVITAFKDQRPLLQKFEDALAQMLAYKSSLDGDDFKAVVGLIWADPQMTRSTQVIFLNFLLRSTEQFASLARDARSNGKSLPITGDEVGYVYFALLARQGVRDVLITYLSEQVAEFDRHLEEIRTITPFESQELAYTTNTSDSLEAQLKRASKTANSEFRDRRLGLLVFRALAAKPPNVEIASSGVAEISEPKLKAILNDYISIAKTMVSAASNDSDGAEKIARQISRTEWRAWAFMALGTARVDKSQEEANSFYAQALEFLEKSSPSPLKVDLMFVLAEMWGYELNQASAIVSKAIKSSNQNMATDDSISSIFNVNGFFPRIGKIALAPGAPPTSLAEVTLPPVIGRLAYEDWDQFLRNSQAIEDLSLRIRYKLAASKSVLQKINTKKKNVATGY